MAITANIEYRLNYMIDAFIQPMLTAGIELLLWLAVFRASTTGLINGFGIDHYLAYALWGAFFARISTSWMYEYRMIEEIESGTVNSLLTRPLSFYEYYFSQLIGYKMITTVLSFLIPFTICFFVTWPVALDRLPLSCLLVSYYLILVHSISFAISSCAFFFNRIHSLTAAKNLTLWILSGEVVPLDLMPAALAKILLILPFSSGVYVPVAYLTQRVGIELVWQGFVSITVAIVVINLFGLLLWRRGLKEYAGTGA
jgi:ABC-2 type transport system permease protein